jgi:hypothetical protein
LVQAVALLRLLPIEHARHVFMWTRQAQDRVAGLAQDWSNSALIEALHRENLDALKPGHAVALVQAMREGGWRKGRAEPLPDIVKLAMRGFRDEGLTVAQIAERFGFGYHTTQYAFRVPHHLRLAKNRVGLVL